MTKKHRGLDDLALHLGPGKRSFLQSLGENPEVASVPQEDLQSIPRPVAENKEMAR